MVHPRFIALALALALGVLPACEGVDLRDLNGASDALPTRAPPPPIDDDAGAALDRDPIDAEEPSPIDLPDAGEAAQPDAANDPDPTACRLPVLAPGDHLYSFEHGGLTREYELHVPPGYTGSIETPLVLYFHPLGATRRYLTRAGTPEKSDAENFLAAYPAGRRGSWNGGACCGPANGVGLGDEVDDVGFVRALVAHAGSIACVDPSRVYATGFSNGGFLAHRLACEASDLIAAIAPVSSVNGLPGGACTPPRPVPVLSINGTGDRLVPYAGGFGFPGVTSEEFVSVAASTAAWAAANNCTGTPVVTYQNGTARCETYASCAGGVEVTQCTLEGAGHCWFGESICGLGTNSTDLIATDATWAFLSRFRMP